MFGLDLEYNFLGPCCFCFLFCAWHINAKYVSFAFLGQREEAVSHCPKCSVPITVSTYYRD